MTSAYFVALASISCLFSVAATEGAKTGKTMPLGKAMAETAIYQTVGHGPVFDGSKCCFMGKGAAR